MDDIRSVRDGHEFETSLLDGLLQSPEGFVLWRALVLFKADQSTVRLQQSLIEKVGPMKSLSKIHGLTRVMNERSVVVTVWRALVLLKADLHASAAPAESHQEDGCMQASP